MIVVDITAVGHLKNGFTFVQVCPKTNVAYCNHFFCLCWLLKEILSWSDSNGGDVRKKKYPPHIMLKCFPSLEDNMKRQYSDTHIKQMCSKCRETDLTVSLGQIHHAKWMITTYIFVASFFVSVLQCLMWLFLFLNHNFNVHALLALGCELLFQFKEVKCFFFICVKAQYFGIFISTIVRHRCTLDLLKKNPGLTWGSGLWLGRCLKKQRSVLGYKQHPLVNSTFYPAVSFTEYLSINVTAKKLEL